MNVIRNPSVLRCGLCVLALLAAPAARDCTAICAKPMDEIFVQASTAGYVLRSEDPQGVPGRRSSASPDAASARDLVRSEAIDPDRPVLRED